MNLSMCADSSTNTKKTKKNLGSNLLLLEFVYSVFFCEKTLNCHISETVRTFDLIPTLRSRPTYQLSSD